MGTHFWCISRRSKVVVSMGTSTVPEPGPPRGGTFLHKYQKQCSLWEPFLDLGTCISHQEMPRNAHSLISFSYTPVAMLQMASSNDLTTQSVQQYSCASYRLARRHRSDQSSWSNSKMNENEVSHVFPCGALAITIIFYGACGAVAFLLGACGADIFLCSPRSRPGPADSEKKCSAWAALTRSRGPGSGTRSGQKVVVSMGTLFSQLKK